VPLLQPVRLGEGQPCIKPDSVGKFDSAEHCFLFSSGYDAKPLGKNVAWEVKKVKYFLGVFVSTGVFCGYKSIEDVCKKKIFLLKISFCN